jgi:hypothetical protein
LVREAVADHLTPHKSARVTALEAFLASGDQLPHPAPMDWETVKDSFEREYPAADA